MKKIILILIMAVSIAPSAWHQVRVHVTGEEIPAALFRFDIVDAEPGSWAELVATDADLENLTRAGFSYQVVISDLEAHYASTMSGDGVFGDYYSYHETLAILDSLAEAYPAIISERQALETFDGVDTTWDGNHVWAVKVSDNVDVDEDEPELLYTGIHHAREPIGVNITTDWARWLCENYGSDPLATYLVDEREMWIVPMVNPDGYLINEENFPGGGGMNRKNAHGVDLNRNYPYMWGYDDQGSSPDPGDQTYRGPAPGSEPEITAIMKLCRARDFVTAVNFHSYGNLFYYPWTYIAQNSPDSSVYFGWGEFATRGGHYAVTPGGAGLYLINGGAEDWMYGETGEKPRTQAVTVEVGEAFWQEPEIGNHVAETRTILTATAKAAGIFPEITYLTISDGGDDVISPGETVDITLGIHNMSVRQVSGDLTVELKSADPRVELVTPSVIIPSLPPQTAGDNEGDPLQVRLAEVVQPDSAIALDLVITTAAEEFVYDIALPVGPRKILLADDFEGSFSAAWTGDWGSTDERSHSGDRSVTDSPYTGYPAGQSAYLVSPAVDLSDKVTAELNFWHWYSIQKEHVNQNGQDWGVLEARTGVTEEWITLKRFTGAQTEWAYGVFCLDEFCGTAEFQVRFGLVSDITLELDGWYVDDVEISAFSGAVSSGVAELVEARPVVGPSRTVSSGEISFTGPPGVAFDAVVFDESGRRMGCTSGTTPFTWRMQDDRGIGLAPGVYFITTTCHRTHTTRKVVVVD